MGASFYQKLQPIYPMLVRQWADDYGLTNGTAVDIGTGPGFLGIELAKITSMEIMFLDIQENALLSAQENFNRSGCPNTVDFVCANVADLPFADGFADFVMSRGSLWFWDKPECGLSEIQRILKKGGVAVVGGGLGHDISPELREELIRENRKSSLSGKGRHPTFRQFSKRINRDLATKAGLRKFSILEEGDDGMAGRWFEIRK
jgi:ubiquinone/menaquinone biosynthesis C-methylase UbiE